MSRHQLNNKYTCAWMLRLCSFASVRHPTMSSTIWWQRCRQQWIRSVGKPIIRSFVPSWFAREKHDAKASVEQKSALASHEIHFFCDHALIYCILLSHRSVVLDLRRRSLVSFVASVTEDDDKLIILFARLSFAAVTEKRSRPINHFRSFSLFFVSILFLLCGFHSLRLREHQRKRRGKTRRQNWTMPIENWKQFKPVKQLNAILWPNIQIVFLHNCISIECSAR